MPKSFNYVFVDESGDPGKPYKTDKGGNKIPTGASLFYILSAVCVDSKKLFAMENRIMEIKGHYSYRSELKAQNIPLKMYKDLLDIINELKIKIYYRLIDKTKYRGTFAVDGKKKLHNVFDEYNLVKLVSFAIKKCRFDKAEVIIDRADRRLLDGRFDNFNNYLINKVNTKTIKIVEFITHVNSEYVNVMQMSDLVSGAIKDDFTGKNKELLKIINKRFLEKIW
ncbi:DUF3800 domain-containing protein [Patescibacteria group bacterium]|nr:DUF3800 domain-containing protein [Patescibacteria group bacterium]MBU4368053.1 DUF3800 domain-containing protein [Patescibacteria group bacterium]MBU4462224.1 DUF3800 domain-containing protein [Patescibacteria group bacterium]MCG2699580.1 DUF3800 domain-containing protein [Candidatus Parcubacteria bacterium]